MAQAEGQDGDAAGVVATRSAVPGGSAAESGQPEMGLGGTEATPRTDDTTRRLERELSRAMGHCIGDYELIGPQDRVMVCISGGKDSYVLLHLLERARRRAPFVFEIVAVHLDQGQPGYDGRRLEEFLAASGIAHRIVREDTYSVVVRNVKPGATYCSICSRMRRGVLYNVAEAMGCTKIALGHHRDDAIETMLMNQMFNGTLAAMPPKMCSKDGRNTVIRPLLYAAESTIAAFAQRMAFPILPCNLCGSQEHLMRQQVKAWLNEFEQRIPRVRQSLLGAAMNVHASHLLDRGLWQALGVAAASEDGPAMPDDMASRHRLPVL